MIYDIIVGGCIIVFALYLTYRLVRKKEVKRMNLNDLARTVTLREGKKRSVSIAQVKEIMRILFEELSKKPFLDVWDIIKRYKKKR